MSRILAFLFLIFIFSCCDQSELLKNGLTIKTNKIIDYTIIIEKDSLNHLTSDTLTITERFYNNNDQIIYRIQKNLFDGENIKIEYVYNKFNKIEREIVNLSSDSTSFTVNYFYKDSLQYKAQSDEENKIFRFHSIVEYGYDSRSNLKESTSKSYYIDFETNDTITNFLETSKYNKKELITETVIIDYIKPERNRKTKFIYNCHLLTKIRKFNHNDSLISTTKYKYEMDKFENWIKRESYINGKMDFIKTREIMYN